MTKLEKTSNQPNPENNKPSSPISSENLKLFNKIFDIATNEPGESSDENEPTLSKKNKPPTII